MENQVKWVEGDNKVEVRGRLLEVKCSDFTNPRNQREALTGEAVIEVGENQSISVGFFQYKYDPSKKGAPVPTDFYNQLKAQLENLKSVASHGDEADEVTLYAGSIRQNEYLDRTDKMVSFPNFSARGINSVSQAEKGLTPYQAVFALSGVFDNVKPINDAEGIPTGEAEMTVHVPTYIREGEEVGGVFTSTIYLEPEAYHFIEGNYQKGQTIQFRGNIFNFLKEDVKLIEPAFGDPYEEKTTQRIMRLELTHTDFPVDESSPAHIDVQMIGKALEKRKATLEAEKERRENKANKPSNSGGGQVQKTTPSQSQQTFTPPSSQGKPVDISDDDLPF